MLATLIIVAALPTRSPQHALSEPLQQFVSLLQHRLEAKRRAHLPPAPSISAPPSAAPTPTAAPLIAHLDPDTFCADVVPWAPPDLRGLAAYQHRAAHANLEHHYRPLLAGVDAPTASVCAALMKEIVCGSYFPHEEFPSCKAIIFRRNVQCTPIARPYESAYESSTTQQVANYLC